ncbi:D-serine ammonia-lyase DSD1 NDAI_0B02730 [Naumovozyma dairenensis CBS 421]|uniref:D-serine dehydratase n=1 Tax=Naumovozyma dairenensis (strain ATCC 10597 / BCRC 20456 / CBS 421 / NBRC 0211 / NRRL Y-12639) TaxID=1071378 RepID=G0W697_NAUDC|nr:hypothetical protein NDAI_0B02730 [Naumovozyma dairenensis CBS 421]CCD23308.1 hypothetical protein NDAI_0B02730 [Naumovozyma dairenensis CBS 421]
MTDLLSKYKGTTIDNLPTPCFVINEKKFKSNCRNMLNSIHKLEDNVGKHISFRAHVKTHKTAQGTFKQLGHGVASSKGSNSILVSTIKEAKGILDYQEVMNLDYVKDIAFSLPACVPSYIRELSHLSKRVNYLRVFVDNIEHLENLRRFGPPSSNSKWSIFVKIDMGTHRAGIPTDNKDFLNLLKRLFSPDIQKIANCYGFYAHCGHSYSARSVKEAANFLKEEIVAVNTAAKIALSIEPGLEPSGLVLSVGATPTSNSLQILEDGALIEYIKEELISALEIHCGNYCLYDLQQVSTKCVELDDIAGTVLGTVVSSYESRMEILTDTGVMSLTRETSAYKGFGLCRDLSSIMQDTRPNIEWYVDRVSQEHGILKKYDAKGEQQELLPLGSKVAILPQHACIVMGQFDFYFILDEQNQVVDVWTPFQKW